MSFSPLLSPAYFVYLTTFDGIKITKFFIFYSLTSLLPSQVETISLILTNSITNPISLKPHFMQSPWLMNFNVPIPFGAAVAQPVQ
jgi:hypothetical protein